MKKKVIIVGNYAEGMRLFRQELIAEFLKDKQVILSLPTNVKEREAFEELGCRYINTPIDRRGRNLLREIVLLAFYIGILIREKPDVVLTYAIKPNIYMGIACQCMRIPYVSTVEGLGTAYSKEGILKKFVQIMYRLALRKASIVFVLNKRIHDEMKKNGLSESILYDLPGMGVNISYFTPQRYPINASPCLLTVGRVMKDKGIKELIGAAKILENELPNLTWHVVGFVEKNEEELFEELKKGRNIIYHDLQQDVRPFYKMCHALITTSYHEGMSMVCLEAGASARPILGTNIYGVRETFVEGISGYAIREKSVKDTVRIIKKFFSKNQETREEMGRASREKIELEFNRQCVVAEIVRIVNSVLSSDRSI